ncbi:MAG: WXG100 family type VII secretion target [Nocardiopsaceae bacterium]|nr:WXG100 family type VII secretion target [Nocardiopsaceae bacterium]
MADPTTLLHADCEKLAEAYDQFRSALWLLQETVERLEAELDRSLDQWDGSAHTEYLRFAATWHQDCISLTRVLQRLGSVVRTAEGNYTAAAEANLTMWECH